MSAYDHTRLDRLIHSRIRLAVLSLLAGADSVAFTYLRDRVNTSDGNLASHLRKLEEAGYVEMTKTFEDRRPITRYRITDTGRDALAEYAERLAAMLGEAAEG